MAGAMAATVAGALGIVFVYDRLDCVSRSLPVLQFLTGICFLTALRVLHRVAHELRQHRKTSGSLLKFETPQTYVQCVLVVGINRLSELYLQAVAEAAPGQVKIAGLLGRANRHTGRLVANYPVLGTPENIQAVLDSLEIHGVTVDSIVVSSPFETLSSEARDTLLYTERDRNIHLRFIAEDLGFIGGPSQQSTPNMSGTVSADAQELSFDVPVSELDRIAKRHFWALKRLADFVFAVILLLVLSPLMLATALLVAASLGRPVLFWQQRPGLCGRNFRLFKFRTMRRAHSSGGRKLGEGERASRTGNLLRRLRLDELPQLFSIIWGDMSFVGPRPLLPRDQSTAHRARLLVRPGLTGWAQVIGGRNISPEDKAALDVWYVRNASLGLDTAILIRTLPVVLFGERIKMLLIERAWRELSDAGVLSDEMASRVQNRLHINYGRV